MIDLNNLIDLFPYYFKDNDSYKVDGKGLLERFLNICGDYFQRYPLADMDNFLEILDVNTTNIIFVNNFWKFFGELPFAQGPIVDPELFSKTFTGFNFDEAIKTATRSTEAYTGKAEIDYRNLIKYSISLFKIRGTKQFFDIMFRLYGMTVTMTFPGSEDPFLQDHTSRFDVEESQYDKATFDNYYRCNNCSDVTFTVTPPTTLSDQSKVLAFANQVKAFIDRFVPFYINPILQVSGWNTLNKVSLDAVVSGNSTLGLGESTTITVTVKPIVSGNTMVSTDYQVAVTDTGEAPKEEDWAQPQSDPDYTVTVGNKDYYFRPVADTSIVKKIHITEQYTTVQYMIWVDSPREPEKLILSEENQKINLVIKATEYTFVYRDNALFSSTEKKPSIIWDNAPDGVNSVFNNGEANVEVDYYGPQIFSIASYRTKKVTAYIGVDDNYKQELDALILSLEPQYLLIQDNTLTPGTVDSSNNPTGPGVYGSSDGKTWKPADFETIFKVVNRDDQPQLSATIVDINNTSKVYKPGDAFKPPTAGASSYTFRASQGNQESETQTLYIKTNTTEVYNPIPISLTVAPTELSVEYSPDPQTRMLEGTLQVRGLSKQSAQSYVPQIEVKKGGNLLATLNGIYQKYSGTTATYTFQYTHTIEGENNYAITFFAKDKTTVNTTVQVSIFKTTTSLYLTAYDHKDQWTVDNSDATEEDIEKRRGTELTFTAKQGTGNNIAKFTFGGSYVGNLTDGTNTYSVDDDETPISMEVTSNKDIRFYAQGDSPTNPLIILHLRDFAGVVEISCNPTEATLSSSVTEVSTTVTGSTNKSNKFRFTIDNQQAIREIENNGAYDFKTSTPGTHTFTSVDDPSKVAYFEVKSNVTTPQIQVTKSDLSWDADDTSSQSFEILVPSTVLVTITEE